MYYINLKVFVEKKFFAREFHREVYVLFCFTSKGKEFVSGKTRVKEEEKCILAYVFMQ